MCVCACVRACVSVRACVWAWVCEGERKISSNYKRSPEILAAEQKQTYKRGYVGKVVPQQNGQSSDYQHKTDADHIAFPR